MFEVGVIGIVFRKRMVDGVVSCFVVIIMSCMRGCGVILD